MLGSILLWGGTIALAIMFPPLIAVFSVIIGLALLKDT
jgi:hypothetical protein